MISKRKVVCVSTTKPSTSLTPRGGGGSLTLLCPRTGSIQSSLRIAGDGHKVSLGVSSLSTFPARFSSNNSTLAIGFGSTGKKDDSYGLLVTLRPGASPPVLHWKCRLPEAQMSAGLLVSPCGNYIVGGGVSGSLYVWKAIGGTLLRTVKAHYRAVATMSWSTCGRHLVTGGADGMVHVFSLTSLVELVAAAAATLASGSVSSASGNVQPIRTWTKHHLPVTALAPMTSGRIASTSHDGQVILYEICSGSVLASIQLPTPVLSLAIHADRLLLVGTTTGTIHMVDLNEYAMHRTAQQGATVVRRRGAADSYRQRVFGGGGETGSTNADKDDNNSSNNNHQDWMELHGHNRGVTAMAVLDDSSTGARSSDDQDHGDWLWSGDESGTIRVWDLNSRTCVRVLQPWSHSTSVALADVPLAASHDSNAVTAAAAHPVTCICMLEQDDESDAAAAAARQQAGGGLFWNNSNNSRRSHTAGRGDAQAKNNNSIVQLVTPLQKFPPEQATPLCIPFLQSKRRYISSKTTMDRLEMESHLFLAKALAKRRRLRGTTIQTTGASHSSLPPLEASNNNNNTAEEMTRLRNELEQAKSTIQRWEAVNNKLMARLQQQQQSPPAMK